MRDLSSVVCVCDAAAGRLQRRSASFWRLSLACRCSLRRVRRPWLANLLKRLCMHLAAMSMCVISHLPQGGLWRHRDAATAAPCTQVIDLGVGDDICAGPAATARSCCYGASRCGPLTCAFWQDCTHGQPSCRWVCWRRLSCSAIVHQISVNAENRSLNPATSKQSSSVSSGAGSPGDGALRRAARPAASFDSSDADGTSGAALGPLRCRPPRFGDEGFEPAMRL